MYFKLINDIHYESSVNIYEPEGLPVEFDLMSGFMMSADIKTPLVYTTDAAKGDEIRDFWDSSFLLMSKKFLQLVQQAGVDNLQVYPAVIKSLEDGTVWENYFGVNILGLISCAVLSKSSYDEIMPGHYAFDELAIDLSKTQETLLFRLQEHSPTILMHNDIGKHIVDNDPDGELKGWSVDDVIQ
ncbi:hypothetical protein SAMN02745866_03978 [Alteromonadaceae bacterium Bs31]|nr:hypothetical protein SAMN02745866_03978 [Alteromonadaceae bacterium Bs31]